MNTFIGELKNHSNLLKQPLSFIPQDFHSLHNTPITLFYSSNRSENIFINSRYLIVLDGKITNWNEIKKKYPLEAISSQENDLFYLSELLKTTAVNTIVNDLLGAFSMVVIDKQLNKITLARDCFGLKPLYYGLTENSFLFASRFDHIHKHPSFPTPELRPEIMKEFLSFGYMHAPNTVFKNIYQVEAGQIVEWDVSTETTQKNFYYKWQIKPSLKESAQETEQAAANLLKTIIKETIQKKTVTATFLSGGIDSPLVTAYAAQLAEEVTAFTFSIDDKDYNEAAFAKEYATLFKVKQHEEKIHPKDFLKIIDDHFEALSEPLGDYSSIPTYFISKTAKKYTDEILSGDGGDELFWGYPRFIKSAEQAKWFKIPLSIRKLIIPIIRKIIPDLSYALEVEPTFGDWIKDKQVHLNTDSLIPGISFSKELESIYEYKEVGNKEDVFHYLKKNEIQGHLQRVQKKVELVGRHLELEVYAPFLDKRMLNFSNSIIPELHKHKRPKYILKNLLSKESNEELVNLPKKGFGVPIEEWLRNELATDVKEQLLNKPFYGEEYIDRKVLFDMIHAFYDNKKTINGWGLWHLYVWQRWSDQIQE